mmetsp:Transcript_10768/g.25989  ORF Transcript_10768/g.25989 Transcript_10768/m.25989 type:complete len:207 (-) Transcript_10768:784-1404(-)
MPSWNLRRWSNSSRSRKGSPSWVPRFPVELFLRDRRARVRRSLLARLLAKLVSPSSRFRVRSLLKCLLAWVPRVSVTSLIRPRRMPRALSSLTKLTLSVASAELESLAATMSASRRSTSCWWKWMALRATQASLSLPPLTEPMFWIARCCDRVGLTVASSSTCLTLTVVSTFSKFTARESLYRQAWTWKWSPAELPASPEHLSGTF